MQTNHRGRLLVQPLLCGVLFLVFASITAIGILAQKHAAEGIECLPDPRLALLVRFGIIAVMLFAEMCCVALLLAVCFARCGRG
ncbi:hypothetical protein [Ralstonia solanacearum]|uniref:hypothetical protein n=1 Tax=Ralstonia solanacearum TaxID=305 RepID=UPI00078DA510|nr:hypothetical protein [Ralstonia solanacearum]AMP37469.1 hypothetical protein LBM2029_07910 [Ralstonia solanacearum]AXV86295.1 hypothetical protein CJO78_08205 [Ralstonia solanacearum]AXW05801.1 hypothetical protein CJO82_07980 [Ralstonia solanacearum]AXW23542.1 hypothetical protein CJO86_07985 [Ralstonia solanacearum]AXW80474.1 hypothetical protein CJO98_08215 [Ralstonia solanacearum]